MDRYKRLMREYEQNYDLTTLNTANDRLNLETLVRNTVLIERLDDEINTLMESGDIAGAITTIDKLSRTKSDLIEKNALLERQLGIDRKSRKKDNETSPAEYIIQLKRNAKEFLDQRLTKVYCPKCNILIMRFSAAYDHVEFRIAAQCPQCDKSVTAHRKERDIFYDIHPRDREWRRRHPIEIIPPKKEKVVESADIEDEFIIDDGMEE